MWNNLTISQKSNLMRVYLKYGISSLDLMKEHYNSFAEGGNKDEPIKSTYSAKQIEDNTRYYQIDDETVGAILPPISIVDTHPLWDYPNYRNKRNNPNIQRHKDALYAVMRGHEKAGKKYMQWAVPAALAPVASMAAPIIGTIVKNPLVDAALTVESIVHAPKNIKQSIQNIKDGEIIKGIGGLGLTALDFAGAGNLVTTSSRIAKKAYRANHAYNTITPVDYQSHKEQVKNYLHDLWYDTYSGRAGGDAAYGQYGKAFGPNLFKDAREEAFRIYLGKEPNPKIFVKTGNNSYRYNLPYINEHYSSPFFISEPIIQAPRGIHEWNTFNTDFIGGVGGNIHLPPVINDKYTYIPQNGKDYSHFMGINYNGRPVMESLPLGDYDFLMHDTWDVHPLSRETDKLSKKIENYLNEKQISSREKVQNFRKFMYDKKIWGFDGVFPNSKLNTLLNKYRTSTPKKFHISSNPLIQKLNDKIGKVEAGLFMGGKPFDVQTHIPVYNTLNSKGSEIFFIDKGRIVE